MQLPPPVIAYVLAHELARLTAGDHSPELWALVRTVMPDFERRRERLAFFGEQVWLGCDGPGPAGPNWPAGNVAGVTCGISSP